MKISATIQYFMYHDYKKIDRFLISQNMIIDEKTRTYIQLNTDQNFSFSEKKTYTRHILLDSNEH